MLSAHEIEDECDLESELEIYFQFFTDWSLKYSVKYFVLSVKMNEIVNKFLLACDKFMPGMYLKQPGFTYSACGRFTKNKDRIENFM